MEFYEIVYIYFLYVYQKNMSIIGICFFSVYTCMTYKHTCIHTYKHTYKQTSIHAYTHTCIHTCIHAYMNTHIHTSKQAYKHTSIQAYMHTYMHTHMAYKYTSIQAYMQSCIHIHTYMHKSIVACNYVMILSKNCLHFFYRIKYNIDNNDLSLNRA